MVLPLLLIAAWYSHHVYTSVKPVYYSQAVIGVSPPDKRIDQAAPGEGVPRNGLLDLGGASLITNMATLGLGDSSVRGQVAAAGGKPDYTVRMFPVPGTMPELPMIMIEATEPDAVSASKTVELVVAQAGSALRTLQQQANVPNLRWSRHSWCRHRAFLRRECQAVPGQPSRSSSAAPGLPSSPAFSSTCC